MDVSDISTLLCNGIGMMRMREVKRGDRERRWEGVKSAPSPCCYISPLSSLIFGPSAAQRVGFSYLEFASPLCVCVCVSFSSFLFDAIC